MENLLSYLKYTFIIGLSLSLILKYFISGRRTKANRDLLGKIIIITGCSAGIGKETARALLNKGAKVIFACRDKKKTDLIIEKITNENTIKNAFFIQLNLSSLNSVGKFVNEFNKKFDKLDILINNAGCVNQKLSFSEDNIENTIQTNHISHVLLTSLLLRELKKSNDPRVINVGSGAHSFIDDKLDYFKFNEENYAWFNIYGISKAANILFSESLVRFSKHKNEFENLLSCCPTPGAVNTEIVNTKEKTFLMKFFIITFMWPFMYFFFKSEEMGAQTSLHCCYMKRDEFKNGE